MEVPFKSIIIPESLSGSRGAHPLTKKPEHSGCEVELAQSTKLHEKSCDYLITIYMKKKGRQKIRTSEIMTALALIFYKVHLSDWFKQIFTRLSIKSASSINLETYIL